MKSSNPNRLRFRRAAGLALGLTLSVGCASTPPPEAADPIAVDGEAVALEGKRYLETRVGITIDAPPEVVWEILTTAEGFTDWNSTLISLEGNIENGGTVKLVPKTDPDRTYELEVSAFEPTERMVWEDGGAAFRGVRTYSLTAVGDGTEFRMGEVMTGSMMGMIAPKLPDFRPSFEQYALDLKTEAESRAGAAEGDAAPEPDSDSEVEAGD